MNDLIAWIARGVLAWAYWPLVTSGDALQTGLFGFIFLVGCVLVRPPDPS